jgi:hypothetical protein
LCRGTKMKQFVLPTVAANSRAAILSVGVGAS